MQYTNPNTAICEHSYKGAALYFDAVIPLHFYDSKITDDIEFPEDLDLLHKRIHKLVNISKSHSNTETMELLRSHGKFLAEARSYFDELVPEDEKLPNYPYFPSKYRPPKRGSYEEVYLRSIRDHLGHQEIALFCHNDMTVETQAPGDDVITTLANLKLINTDKTPWDQIFEFKSDSVTWQQFIRLKLFFFDNYKDHSRSYILDDLNKRLVDYHEAIKKHGFETITGSIEQLLNSRSLLATASISLSSLLLGVPEVAMASASVGASLEIGSFALKIARGRFAISKYVEHNELAFLVNAKKCLDNKT